MLNISTTAQHENASLAQSVDPLPRGILCAGAKSSASTWLYNVVEEILRRRGEAEASSYTRADESPLSHAHGNVRQFYADSPRGFSRYDPRVDTLVVQTQQPSDALSALAACPRFQVVMTIREPRDAVASLMKRFGFSFAGAFRAVAEGDARIVGLFRRRAPLVLRFEDRFYEREVTLVAIADFLGVDLPAMLVREIFNALTRESVVKKIESMRQGGVLDDLMNPTRHDPQTRWRLGHVGEIAIGQHAEFLSREQQLVVLTATAEYCAEFGYPAD
ncbi:MAG TPA: hypothetical protein VG274_06415 [Rhizomicrobium sp.]|nr:hypothetical protein [Rhizomicrobium sp.]